MVDIPNTFVPGEVASATEVNENFNALKDGINQNSSYISSIENDIIDIKEDYALVNGSIEERFEVKDPVNDNDAVNKRTLEKYFGNLFDYISGLEIVKDDDHTVLVSNGQCYDTRYNDVLLVLNSGDEQNPWTSLLIGTATSATYNIFLTGDENGNNIALNASQEATPSNSPARYRKIGEVGTDSEGVINRVVYYGNTSGTQDIPHQISNVAPNYGEVSVLIPNTEYTANEPTWVYMFAVAQNNKTIYYTINNVNYKFAQNRNDDTDTSSGVIMLLLSYGDTYKLPTSNGSYHQIKSFKCRGV